MKAKFSRHGCVCSLMLCLLSFIFLSLLGPQGARAQTATGTIRGTVTDPKGLAMVGATVLVHSVDTGSDDLYHE